jgi:hypothetical protein
MSEAEHSLRVETEAVRDLMAVLRDQGAADDAELVTDAIEGETSLLEAITSAIDEIDEAEVLILGGKAKIEQIGTRVSMEEKRVERLRAAIERAMVITEQDKPLRLPSATLSIARRKPQPVIDNEADIPARFFTQPPAPPPKLDKKALAEALASGPVPGARLDNGTISLTVRRK